MNIHVDTLEYASDLEKAGIERAHAEAIAKLPAKTIGDLIDHELVTRDHFKSELAQLEARLKSEMSQIESRTESKLGKLETVLREEIRNEANDQRRQTDALMIQIRALQLGGAISAFAIGAIVLLTRLIK